MKTLDSRCYVLADYITGKLYLFKAGFPLRTAASKMEWPPMMHRKSSSILRLSRTCANNSAVCGLEVGGSSTVKPCLGLMALKYVSILAF